MKPNKRRNKPRVISILESVFVNAAEKLETKDAGRAINAFCVQVDMTNGEIQIYDDREVLLEKNIIFDWAEQSPGREGNARRGKRPPEASIRTALAGLKGRRFFEKPLFMRPFRVVLTDEVFNEMETLFTLKEHEASSRGEWVMKNLDKELKAFSKKLFAD